MKTLILSLLFFSPLCAEPVKIDKFQSYENVVFTEIVGDSVKFTHKNGTGRVKINELPKSILEKLKGLEIKEKEAAAPVVTLGEIAGEVFSVKPDGIYIQSIGFKINGQMKPFPKGIALIFLDDTSMYSDGQEGVKIQCYAVGNHKVGTLVMPRFTTDKVGAIEFATPAPQAVREK
jgi:hypothetical protein